MNPADVLEAAAEVIERDGWCRGTADGPDGSTCMVGAVWRVISPATPEWRFIYTALRRHVGGPPMFWNDSEAADEFEVIDALRLCAKDLRNRAES